MALKEEKMKAPTLFDPCGEGMLALFGAARMG